MGYIEWVIIVGLAICAWLVYADWRTQKNRAKEALDSTE